MNKNNIYFISILFILFFSCQRNSLNKQSSGSNVNVHTDIITNIDTLQINLLHSVFIQEDPNEKVDYLKKINRDFKKDSLYIGLYAESYGNIYSTKDVKNWNFWSSEEIKSTVIKSDTAIVSKNVESGSLIFSNKSARRSNVSSSSNIGVKTIMVQFKKDDSYLLNIFLKSKNNQTNSDANIKAKTQGNSVTTGNYYYID